MIPNRFEAAFDEVLRVCLWPTVVAIEFVGTLVRGYARWLVLLGHGPDAFQSRKHALIYAEASEREAPFYDGLNSAEFNAARVIRSLHRRLVHTRTYCNMLADCVGATRITPDEDEDQVITAYLDHLIPFPGRNPQTVRQQLAQLSHDETDAVFRELKRTLDSWRPDQPAANPYERCLVLDDPNQPATRDASG